MGGQNELVCETLGEYALFASSGCWNSAQGHAIAPRLARGPWINTEILQVYVVFVIPMPFCAQLKLAPSAPIEPEHLNGSMAAT